MEVRFTRPPRFAASAQFRQVEGYRQVPPRSATPSAPTTRPPSRSPPDRMIRPGGRDRRSSRSMVVALPADCSSRSPAWCRSSAATWGVTRCLVASSPALAFGRFLRNVGPWWSIAIRTGTIVAPRHGPRMTPKEHRDAVLAVQYELRRMVNVALKSADDRPGGGRPSGQYAPPINLSACSGDRTRERARSGRRRRAGARRDRRAG
jgi:hypothetical protein